MSYISALRLGYYFAGSASSGTQSSACNILMMFIVGGLTIREHAHGQHIPVFRQVRKCNIWRPLPDHQVHRDQALEDDGPC